MGLNFNLRFQSFLSGLSMPVGRLDAGSPRTSEPVLTFFDARKTPEIKTPNPEDLMAAFQARFKTTLIQPTTISTQKPTVKEPEMLANYGIVCPTFTEDIDEEPIIVAQNYGIVLSDIEEKPDKTTEMLANYGIVCFDYKDSDKIADTALMNYGIVCFGD